MRTEDHFVSCATILTTLKNTYRIRNPKPERVEPVKTSEVFGSNYLKAVDLGKSRVTVTIERIDVVKMGDKRKPVLFFRGKEKGLVLNLTNCNQIIGMTGTDEMDEWVGQRINLFATKVDFQGKRVDAIRVEDPPPAQKTAAKPKPHEVVEEDEDPVPF